MSQCTDVDAAIRRLEGKINAQNQLIANQSKQIADLKNKQEQCCNNKRNNNQNNDLAKRVAAIESYINSLDGAGKTLQGFIRQIVQVFR